MTASSQNSPTQTASKAIDGVISGYPVDATREWATAGAKTGTLTLTWSAARTISSVTFYDRPNTDDRVTAGTLTFSNGTAVTVPTLDNAGGATTVTFPPRSTTSLRFTITSSSPTTSNVGLAEIEVYGYTTSTATATPTPTPTPTARRRPRRPRPQRRRPRRPRPRLRLPRTWPRQPRRRRTRRTSPANQTAAKAIDGSKTGYPGDSSKEWATVGGKAGSWLLLTWSAPAPISSVTLYDRPNTSDRVTGGTLAFSDGSVVTVPSLDNAGAATTVTFSPRSTTSIRFTVTGAALSTTNIGLAEIEALGYLTSAPAGAVSRPAGFVTKPIIVSATEPDQPEPGATPEEARAALGVAPEVEVGASLRRSAAPEFPWALGTAVITPFGDARVRVQPVSVASVAGGGDEKDRLVRIEVDLSVLDGTAEYTPHVLAIQDAEGNLYPAVEDATAPGSTNEPLGSGTLEAGGSVHGDVYVSIPTSADAPKIVLLAPDGSPVTSWSLSSH